MILITFSCNNENKKISKAKINMAVGLLVSLMALSSVVLGQLPKIGNEWTLDKAISLKNDNPQKSISMAKQVVEETNSPLLKYQALKLLGSIAKKYKEYSKAEIYYKEAYEVSLVLKDTDVSIRGLSDIADILRFTKKNDEALSYIQKSIDLSTKNNMHDALVTAYSVKGNIYKSAKRYDEALETFRAALNVIEKNSIKNRKSRIYSHIATMYARLNKLEKAVEYKVNALEVEEGFENKNTEQIVKYCTDISTFTRKLGDYGRSLQYSLRGLNLVSELDSPKLEQRILLNLTIIYRKLSVYDTSLKYAMDLRKSYENDENHKKVVTANIQIALIYDNLKQYDDANKFYQKALDVPIEKSGEKYRASANRGKASVLYKQGDNESGLLYAEKARSLFLKLEDKFGIETVERLIGEINASLGNKIKAREAFERALAQSRMLGASWPEANNLILIGKLLIDDDHDQAYKYVEEGVSIAKKITAKRLILEGYEAMMEILYNKKSFKSAYEYSLLANNLSSEINKENIFKRITDLKIINEVDEKERKIEFLKRKAEIDSLELATQATKIQLLDKKNTISKLKLEQERYKKIFLLACAVMVFVIFIVLFRLHLKSRVYEQDKK